MVANMTFGVNLIPKTDNTYSLGNSDHKWAIYGDVQPIASEVYENYTVSANDINNGFIYFLKLNYNDTSNTYIPKSIHYILEVTTSEARTQGYYDVWIGICETGVYRYKIFNHFSSNLYYPIYGHIILASNGSNLDRGAYLGVRVNGARTPTTLARTYSIKVLEVNGCTVEFLDSIQNYSVLYDSTYYINTEFNGTTIGLQESGDINSLIKNEASGVIASFKDGADNIPMESVIVNIEPIQDLRGYDNPWPAGGGKNLLPIPSEGNTINGITFTVNTNGTISINGTATADAYFYLYSGTIELQAGDYASLFSDEDVSVTLQLRIGGSSGSDVMGSATSTHRNATVSSTTNVIGRLRVANGITVNNVTVYPMLALQSATLSVADFEPYANICSISGRTGLSVTYCGKNLLPIRTSAGTNHGLTYTPVVVDGLVTGVSVSGTQDGSASVLNIMPGGAGLLLPAGTYILSGGTETAYVLLRRDTSGGTQIAQSKGAHTTFTLTEPTLVFCNGRNAASSETLSNVMLYPMIRKAENTDETFKPYQGNTFNIDWTTEAGTVYGGTLDVVAGVLTVNKASVDLGTLVWSYSESWGTASAPMFSSNGLRTLAVWDTGSYDAPDLICSKYKTCSRTYLHQNNVPGVCFANTEASPDIIIRDANYSDATAFTTSLSGVTAVYKMKTPQTYQLTPQEIRSLLGENNVFADSGDTLVKYYADTKLYINNKTPTKTSDLINDKQFAPQYFAYCNTPAKTALKVIDIPEITQLTTGLTISVQFQYANGVANPEISLNGGAGIALYKGTGVVGSAASSSWVAGSVVTFTYDGTYWQLANFNNNTYSAMSEAEAIAGTATSSRAITAARLKQAIETHAPVSDVKINGTSILSNKIADIPLAANDEPGVVKVSSTGAGGIGTQVNGGLVITTADATEIKAGSNTFKPITPSNQASAAFYGLAAAAGDSTQSASSNAVGTYTSGAKNAIQAMLGVGMGVEQVSGTTPTITAVMNTRYVCGEVTTLSITPPAQGSCEVIFTVGNYLTALTLPSTVKMPEWFMIETNRIYDIIITDGIYGAVMSWEA